MKMRYVLLAQGFLATAVVMFSLRQHPADDLQNILPRFLGPYKKPTIEQTARAVASSCAGLNEVRRKDLTAAVQQASEEFQIEPPILLAMILKESSCRLKAKSRRGAAGLMQLMPSTAKQLGVGDPFLLKDNVFGGAKYLASLLKQFDGDLHLALAAYNAGPGNVKKFGRIPPYPETRNYVRGVLQHYQELTGEQTT
jgi:soluble lytic murein transglycosylase-like protein